MKSPHFGRVLTAMVTPFDQKGEIDFAVAAEVAKFLVREGSDGLVIAGSTGEGSSLSDDEKLDLARCVVETVNVPVLVGTSSPDTRESVALTARVKATGAAGILATTPAYARPSQLGIAGHLGAMAEATELPLMLYDIPSRTGRKIASATTISLVEKFANIIALKDASGDLVQAKETKNTLGEKLDLYSGDDSLLLDFMAIGGAGIVSVSAHWAGPEFASIVSDIEANDWDAARRTFERIKRSNAWEGTELYPNPMPSKAALRYLGYNVGECRLPHSLSDDVLNAQARDVVSELVTSRG
jgi:4-hydroxy-tetrahydrodipicolinate synthase